MLPFIKNVLKFLRLISMLIPMTLVWILIFMIYFDVFFPPFDRLTPWLMPWKKLFAMPAQSMEERMTFMKVLLDSSITVSNSALVMMTISLLSLGIYLTIVYQQRRRRIRENQLLQLKNQEIARRNEFIRYISATIGHEFKNNLGRIKRRIDLLKDLPPEAKDRIDENMNKLFADIEIFKKISDERDSFLTDFKKIVPRNTLADIAKQFIDLADVTFQDNFSPLTIFASEMLLTMVFENLFDNSIKYKKENQTRAQIILSCSLDTDQGRNYVTLSFRDKGIGMDEEEADRCFYKGRESKFGWGHGLYFAKYVIGLHAGKIKIGKEYTVPRQGTEILISLPYVEEHLYV